MKSELQGKLVERIWAIDPEIKDLQMRKMIFDGDIERIAKAAIAALADRVWQPIETAPRDAIIFLGCPKSMEYYCKWRKGKWCYWGLGDYDNMDWVELPFIPTHWQPLPNPPKESI